MKEAQDGAGTMAFVHTAPVLSGHCLLLAG